MIAKIISLLIFGIEIENERGWFAVKKKVEGEIGVSPLTN